MTNWRRWCSSRPLCGLSLSPGGLAQLLQRVAGRVEDWYGEILQQVRDSRAVFADETSWYVGRPGWGLWVFTTPEATVYCVEESRGSDIVRETPPEPEEVAFRNRLLKQRDHLLECLAEPAAQPTNNRAERDLRPAVINRKFSCGNKTSAGKTAWEILRSVVTTAENQGLDLLDSLTPRLRLAAR